MPIKLPKGFARRKSSGNVLDEVDNGQETSFRVFERPGGGTRSFEGGQMLKNAAAGRFYNNRPATAESDNLFAGIEKPLPNNRSSGGTHHSTSTAGVYDSSSSARYSSSSTLPSSNDGVAHNDPSKSFHDIPAPPVPVAESPSLFSLRAAGRTFSFGTKASRFSTPPQVQRQQTEPQYQLQQTQHQYQQSESAAHARDRAMTASSASTATATPPRLLESDFRLSGTEEDNFGSMFENFGKRKSAIQLRPVDSDDVQSKALPIPPQDERPPPINIKVDHSQPVEPSPYSATSQTSYDGLMNDSNAHIPRQGLAPSQSNHNSNMATSPVSMSSESSGPSTAFIDDADAAIVRQSLLLSSSKPTPPPVPNNRQENLDEETPLFTNDDITSSARLASRYEAEVSSRPTVQNKVMTPAQFERYRQQRELTRKYSNASKSDSSVENDYDEDEDEAEKSREAARQRRKQEAHLSVYRQQMMKVIGEQAPAMSSLHPPPASRLTIDHANSSMPNLSSRMSTLGLPVGRQDNSKSSDGEDDEDVPLGILAAHGFPNKLRPPTRLSASTSNPNLRGSVAPGSVSGESGRDARNSLPVFARNLPSDPYYGAGLVNGPVRESLTFGGGSPGYGPGSPGPMHPGGLVGVIASEERARAMRRGSPNAQAAGMPRPYSTINMSQMGQMGGAHPGMPPQQPSPGEMAQMQINQQMTEMMQVQVQMMQQMMQMQGQAAQMHPGVMPPAAPFVNPGGRPMSTASTYNMPGQDQRTLSLLDPATMSRWNLNRPTSVQPDAAGHPGTTQGVHVYTPSIAPSERSNVGMASRYRPVSTVGQDPHMIRSSTFTSTLKPWNHENQRPVSMTPPMSQASNRKSTSMATVTVRAVSPQGQQSPASKAVPDDDDDDEGWADMKKKREKNKSSWKMKKETPALGDLLHMVH